MSSESPAAPAASRRPPTEAAPAPIRRLWAPLVRAYRELEATRWGFVFLGNFWPAYLFAFPLGLKLMNVGDTTGDALTSPTVRTVMLAVQDLVTTLFLALVVVLFAVRRRVVGAHADWRGGIIAILGTFFLSGAALLPIASTTATASIIASALVVTLGTAISIAGLAFLGRCFGMLPEARGLVQRGPYRWVRHPVYLGEIVSALGLVIAKASLPILGLYIVFVLLQLARARLEEGALSTAFPDVYPRYRLQTGALFPRWR